MSTKLLNRRQAQWSEFLSCFNFRITYRLEKLGGKPDALTQRSGDLPKEGDERLLHQSQTVLKLHNLTVSALNISSNELVALANQELADNDTPADDDQAPADVGNDIDIQNLVDEGYRRDTLPRKVLKALREGRTESKLLALRDCKNRGGYLWYRERLYIPDHALLKLWLI